MTTSSVVSRAVEVFDGVCAAPYATACEVAETGRPVVGYMSCYAPVELLHAAGSFPVRIIGRSGVATQRADIHLPAFACSFTRTVLEMGLAGDLDFLSLVVFVHTCDTMQNLAEIWKWNLGSAPVVTVSFPTVMHGDLPTAFFRQELGRIRRFLETERGGQIDDGTIRASMAFYSEQRILMRRLYARRRENRVALTGKDMMQTVLASGLMPVEDHLALLRELVDAIESGKDGAHDDRPRVMLVGSEFPTADYVAAVEDAGCLVVDDEFSTGAQAFSMTEAEAADPLDALVRRYLDSTPGNAQHRPGFDPGRHLLDKARRARTDGVVFMLTKFCDPWFFDYPNARDTLDEAGIPSLLLEIEVHQEPGQQLRTRTAAFAEMLGTRKT